MKRVSDKIPGVVIMLGVVSLLTDAATEMIYPLVPVYVAALGSGAVMLGMIEGIAETTSSLLKLVVGVLSDRSGKRKVYVLTGYAISSLIRPLTGIVSSAWQIIVIRMLDRVGKGIRSAPRDALIASSAGDNIRGKSFGFHRAMDHTGAVIGPLLAIITLLILFIGFEIKDSMTALRWTFIIALVPGLLAIIALILFVKEPSSGNGTGRLFSFSLKGYDSNFRNYLMIMILFTLGNSSDAFLLFRVQEAIQSSGSVVKFVREIPLLNNMITNFGDEASQAVVINILFLPLVWAFFHIVKAIFSTPMGALSDRIGRKKVIISGWWIYVFVYFSFAVIVFLSPGIQIIATFILFAVYALFYAFSEGAEKAFIADLVGDENRGAAFGLFSLSTGLGSLPASLIFGFLYSYFDKHFPGFGGTVAFGFGGTIALLSIILFTLKVKEPRRGPS